MIEKAVSYAKERKQFNRVIGSFQAVKHMCAEMASDLEPCYAMLWQAAHSLITSQMKLVCKPVRQNLIFLKLQKWFPKSHRSAWWYGLYRSFGPALLVQENWS